METEQILLIACGVPTLVFWILAVCFSAKYFRFTHGFSAAAKVIEHVGVTYGLEKHFTRQQLRLKYNINGAEFVRICPNYVDGARNEYPIGSEVKILADSRNPKSFVLSGSESVFLKLGISFAAAGALAIILMFVLRGILL